MSSTRPPRATWTLYYGIMLVGLCTALATLLLPSAVQTWATPGIMGATFAALGVAGIVFRRELIAEEQRRPQDWMSSRVLWYRTHPVVHVVMHSLLLASGVVLLVIALQIWLDGTT